MRKKITKQRRHPAPAEVFRQFAWHLAGSLAAGRTAAPQRPPKQAGR